MNNIKIYTKKENNINKNTKEGDHKDIHDVIFRNNEASKLVINNDTKSKAGLESSIEIKHQKVEHKESNIIKPTKQTKVIPYNEVDTDIDKTKNNNDKKKKKKERRECKCKYETRDLSWLRFNDRILELSVDESVPLFERLKFLAITASNLDEFSMVRIAKLISISADEKKLNIMNETKAYELKQVYNKVEEFMAKQDETATKLLKELDDKYHIKLIQDTKLLSKGEMKYITKYFNNKVKSLLTPLVFDTSRPFPLISNNTLYIGVILNNNNENIFGTIAVPNIQRLIEIKTSEEGVRKFILLEDLIIASLENIFVGKQVKKTCIYRVLRDFDYKISNKIFIADEIKSSLKRRESNDVVRLDISGNKKEFTHILHKALNISKHAINKTKGFVDLSFFMSLGSLPGYDEDKYKPFTPRITNDLEENNILDEIEDDDIVLHHPFDSYKPILDFIESASTDNSVVAIKQTIYRVTKNSPIMHSLLKAAKNGKHVTILFEAKARFDEANNIEWANRLENAGANVVYGVPGLKTHCKLCLVVRKNKKGDLSKLVHIGTGNYNEKNSKLYTDISYFTSSKTITNDVEAVFNYLTGYSKLHLKNLLCSPESLLTKLIKLVDKEIALKKEGNIHVGIFIKVNGLTDKTLIDKLYEARDAGVPITLVVRSSCSLMDTNGITVKSIVGRFLEHSRIYSFNGSNNVYIASADLMTRNIYNRVEVATKIGSKAINKIKEICEVYEQDTDCFFLKDGKYSYPENRDKSTNAQTIFMENNEEVIANISKICTRNKKKKKDRD